MLTLGSVVRVFFSWVSVVCVLFLEERGVCAVLGGAWCVCVFVLGGVV